MFKRIVLTLTFVATIAAGSFFISNSADAQGYAWRRPYTSYYYAPRSYTYGPYRTFANRYYDGYYGSRPYYSAYYGDPGYYYARPVPRVAVQVGPYWR